MADDKKEPSKELEKAGPAIEVAKVIAKTKPPKP